MSNRAAWTAFVEGTRPKARGRMKAGELNKTEARYETHLEQRRIVGEVIWYRFEGVTLKLADDTRYTPDFAVLMADGLLACHEVKASEKRRSKAGTVYRKPRIEDDARVKIEVAASIYPFVFKVVYEEDGNWIEKEY